MAALATMTMGEINEEKKRIYPLFQKGKKKSNLDPTDSQELPKERIEVKETTRLIKAAKHTFKAKKQSKNTVSTKNSGETEPIEDGGYAEAKLLEVDPNNGRRKRRKTPSSIFRSAPESDDEDVVRNPNEGTFKRERNRPDYLKTPYGGLNHGPMAESSIESSRCPRVVLTDANSNGSVTPTILQTPKSPETQKAEVANGVAIVNDNKTGLESSTTGAVEVKPKKLLKWNPKTGTIGSPPKKAVLSEIFVEEQPPTSTTSKAPRLNSLKSKIVDIHYGRNEKFSPQVGQKILDIMNAPPKPLPMTTDPKPAKTTPTNPTKSLHPIFGHKKANTADKNGNTKNPSLLVEVTSLSKPREARSTNQSWDRPKSPPRKREALMFSAFGGSSGLLKFPGAVEPAWPWKGMVHVRGAEDDDFQSTEAGSDTMNRKLHHKRAKYSAVALQEEEHIISILSSTLNVKSVAKRISETRPDEFSDVPHCLRVPIKHYEGGSALQERVRRKVISALPVPSSSPEGHNGKETHPALARVYGAISSSLSAFDQGKCEVQAWTQKYSPKCASEVLQGGHEPTMLRNWLQTLTVQSVEILEKSSRLGSKADSKGKRKRKSKKHDGFVVSSGEEEDDLDEITDHEDETSDFGGSMFLKKTVVRAGDAAAMESRDPTKLKHVAVISGPHGCGKTATVFAIAKELGFEVFEINPGSRRNGHDITEKVGDMTQNHLVQHSKISTPLDEDSIRIDQALANDLESGRQGTMNSFFKPKGLTKSKSASAKVSASKQPDSKKAACSTKPPSKHQKQSLILIEEADIIFEEDKAFWATIIKLIAQSKRPIIITCNDESSIPLLSLSLHGVFRFRPAPTDLAVDYLLLVAACEGHIIQRHAMMSLYNSRNCDLRAALTDLNYWCQFAVGDVKSGLGWFYPRWPIGKDVDSQGETIRVVSEGTYETGMGGFSQDILESYGHYLDVEQEVLHEAWDGWGLDAGDWNNTLELESWASNMKDISKCQQDNRAALKMYEDFTNSMSAADLSSANAFAIDSMALMEVDQPSAKAREDYIQAFALMGISPKVEFSTLPKDISTWMKCRARKYLQEDQHIRHGFEIQQELNCPGEAQLNQMIVQKVINPKPCLSRLDFSLAFDPIAESESIFLTITGKFEASSFDRSFSLIPLDIAPYVRSIVAFDARLLHDRARLSNLLSEGGSKTKRRRTTRAAMSALEGGARNTTRKDRYFGTRLNAVHVMKTGMNSWTDAAGKVMEQITAETAAAEQN